MTQYADIIINCGVITTTYQGRRDGLLTFGKHKGKYLSDDEVDRSYLAWLYTMLEGAELPDEASEVFDVIWFHGDAKDDPMEVEYSESYKSFDEMLDDARLAMEEETHWGTPSQMWDGLLSYSQNPDTGEMELVTLEEKRKREAEAKKR